MYGNNHITNKLWADSILKTLDICFVNSMTETILTMMTLGSQAFLIITDCCIIECSRVGNSRCTAFVCTLCTLCETKKILCLYTLRHDDDSECTNKGFLCFAKCTKCTHKGCTPAIENLGVLNEIY
jgi:hypothetical protein